FLWIGIVNRLHATRINRRLTDFLTLLCFALMGLGIVGAVWLCWIDNAKLATFLFQGHIFSSLWRLPLLVYMALCVLVAAAACARWFSFRSFRRRPKVLRFHRSRPASIEPARDSKNSEECVHHIVARLPGNEILRLDLSELAIEVPRLAKALEGLRIVHFSDLHFSGKIGKSYFREVVRISNELSADIVAITGDLVEKAGCISWIPDILGRLTARYGVYAILGNHDKWVGGGLLRDALKKSGIVDLGARWTTIDIRGESVIIAGNELPWFKPAADLKTCPPRPDTGKQLRIVLSHCPDQVDWARENDVDLLLTGHTHGGQIRIPIIGPIFSPAASGVKYDSGLFHAPPTIMYVTRGVSAKHPLRWNCPAEVALLTLHAPQG
ncbi:MAG: metallophosphoesterase, partial [Thermoguttaceae bacterium]